MLLYSPRMRDMLYPVGCFNSFQPGRADPRRPDFKRFPRLAQARGMYVEPEPGDMLVIPTGCFHCVWADEAVASVSRFVLDPLVPAHLLEQAEAQPA